MSTVERNDSWPLTLSQSVFTRINGFGFCPRFKGLGILFQLAPCGIPLRLRIKGAAFLLSCRILDADLAPLASGFTLLPFSFYLGELFFVQAPMAWADADAHCQAEGGHLASVGSHVDQDALAAYIKTHDLQAESFWLGGSDLEDEVSPVPYLAYRYFRAIIILRIFGS